MFSVETLKKFKALFSRFQRVRCYTTAACLQDTAVDFSDRTWNDWLEVPAPVNNNVIDGRNMIAAIQKLVFNTGAVDRGFPQRLEHAEKVIYTRFLKGIDAIFGFLRPVPLETGTELTSAPACV